VTALTLPGIDVGTWTVRRRGDSAGRALADRHYSRRTRGASMFTPPGRALILVTPCERAVWTTVHTEYPDDGLDAWRCTLFRNEGAGLSSDLIRAAMTLTVQVWGEAPPRAGWVTYVDQRKVRSSNPGACFLAAGWWRADRDVHPRLRRLHHSGRLRVAA
jgi:hypothetical protein